MSQSRSDTFATAIVQRHHATIAQRQLYLSLTLLAGNLSRYRAVHFVRQPVLTSHSLQLQHVREIVVQLLLFVSDVLIMVRNGRISHNRLGRVSEHLRHIQVERFHTIALHEREMGIARRLTHHIHRCTFTFSNLPHLLNMLFVDEQAHTLLTLIGDNLFRAKCLVADGQFGHIYFTATFFHQFRQAVEMSCRTVVVNADNGIHIPFTQCVIGTFLHFWVRPLYGIEFYTVGIASRIYRRHAASS